MICPGIGRALGIRVLEDVFLALYLAVLTSFLDPAADGVDAVLLSLCAFAFLLALFVVARFGAGRVGRILDSSDTELLAVLFLASR